MPKLEPLLKGAVVSPRSDDNGQVANSGEIELDAAAGERREETADPQPRARAASTHDYPLAIAIVGVSTLVASSRCAPIWRR